MLLIEEKGGVGIGQDKIARKTVDVSSEQEVVLGNRRWTFKWLQYKGRRSKNKTYPSLCLAQWQLRSGEWSFMRALYIPFLATFPGSFGKNGAIVKITNEMLRKRPDLKRLIT